LPGGGIIRGPIAKLYLRQWNAFSARAAKTGLVVDCANAAAAQAKREKIAANFPPVCAGVVFSLPLCV
jgi:hypothetical protein